MTLPSSRRARRRQNVLMWVSLSFLFLTPFIGTLVGTGTLPLVAP